MTNVNKTSLYPVEYLLENCFSTATAEPTPSTKFFVNSANIKVFPSSWRGSEIKTDSDGNILADESFGMPFNPEAALNTEYNITRTAGGIKSYIENISSYADAQLVGQRYFDFKFFINGYAFEIYKLDLTRWLQNTEYSFDAAKNEDNYQVAKYVKDTAPCDLFAYIRVGDLTVGNNAIDKTKVLMPFTWTSLDSPISLDATLETLYTHGKTTDMATWAELVENSMPIGGVNPAQLSTESNTYVFTGLILSTEPINTTNNADNTSSHYFGIQLLKAGQVYRENGWPNDISSGQTENGTSTLIGEHGLKADIPHMLAVGRFNETTPATTSTSEKTLFVVGNGTSDTKRRNALEVLGYTDTDTNSDKYSQTVKIADSLEVSHSNTLKSNNKGAKLNKIYTLNELTEISPNGAALFVNKPDRTGNYNKDSSSSQAGLYSYGNINILGTDATLNFVDVGTWNANSEQFNNTNTIAKIQIVHSVNDNGTHPACGLSISKLHTINPYESGAALSFDAETNALADINNGIKVDANTTYKHSIDLGGTGESAAIKLGESLEIISKAGNSINNLNKLNHLEFTNADDKTTINNISALTGGSTDSAKIMFIPSASNNTLDLISDTLNIKSEKQVKATIDGTDLVNLTSNNVTVGTERGVNSTVKVYGTAQLEELNVASNVTANDPDNRVVVTGQKIALKNKNADNTAEVYLNGVENRLTGLTILDRLELTGGGDGLKQFIVDLIYPVGSIYMCMDAKNSDGNTLTSLANIKDPAKNILHPQAKFGGTWELTSQGRMLLGAGSAPEDTKITYKAGGTGGSKDAVVPSHTHLATINGDPIFQYTSNPTIELEDSGDHEHIISSDSVNDISSAHKHNIPVSMPISQTDASFYNPANFGTLDKDTSQSSDVTQGKDPYFAYTKARPNWWERIYRTDKAGTIIENVPGSTRLYTGVDFCNMTTEIANHMIPAVQMGSWWTPRDLPETFTWNRSGPVYTGYQCVVDKEGNEIPKGTWFGEFDKAWKAFIEATVTVNGENIPLFSYHRYDSGDVDKPRNASPWNANNDYYGASDELLAKFGFTGTAVMAYSVAKLPETNTKWKNFCTTFKNGVCDAIKTALDTTYYGGNLYSLFSSQFTKAAQYDARKIWCSCRSDSGSVPDREIIIRHSAHKLFVLKEALIKDFLDRKARATDTTKDEDWKRDFVFRKDDGIHSHNFSIERGGKHNHIIKASNIQNLVDHYHNISIKNNQDDKNIDISATNANLPPYQVCYIWKRIS